MIEQALRRFCESKHRKLIVIAGTFIVGLLLVMPLVDVIRAGHDEKEALLTELESAQSVASELAVVRNAGERKACPAEIIGRADGRRRIVARYSAASWWTSPRKRLAASAG